MMDGAPASQADSEERAAERVALGHALDTRTDDIIHWCQLEFAKHSGATLDEVAAPQSGSKTTALAVHSIANWLQSGVSASFLDRERIASLGKAAASVKGFRPRRKPNSATRRRELDIRRNRIHLSNFRWH